jgi:UDPglucose 6-dehydrogenase
MAILSIHSESPVFMLFSSISAMEPSYKIAVIGLWHLGETYSVCLAELGHAVVGLDENQAVVDNFSNNMPPLAEPKLAELLAANRAAGRLTYSTDFSAVKDCDIVWVTLDTPVNDEDEVDIEPVVTAIKKAAPNLRDGVLLVISSQLPVGTSANIIAMIKAARPSLDFEYIYSPENLRLGVAVDSFMQPGRVVAGVSSEKAFATFKNIFTKLPADIVSMSPASAEMTKHALNAWLATSISFTNDIADLCERYGADVEAVTRALKSDPRVGPKAYLFAGLGFSGGTLGRDLGAMMSAAELKGMKLPVIQAAFWKNKSRNDIVKVRLEKEMGDIKSKIFAMFGVTYKVGTSTLRRSQSLEIEKILRDAGAHIHLYDPWANAEEVSTITSSSFFNDPYEAAKRADAILVMTPWKDFASLDFGKLRAALSDTLVTSTAPILFDTCNILCDKEDIIKAAGFNYLSIGRA